MSWLAHFRRLRAGAIGMVLIALVVAAALFAPLVAPADPTKSDLRGRLAEPTLSMAGPGDAPLGKDQLGRDILSRLIWGGRVTLLVAAAAVLAGGAIGIGVGLIAGYRGGIADQILMRIVDIQLAFPLMLLALLIVAALGPSMTNLILVLALTSWTRYARIVRGEVLALREREFVLSAVAAGAGAFRIAFRHILPNILPPVIVVATLELGRVIILEAALSFLGVGVQPPTPSWGRMLAEGRGYVANAWWLATFPGLAIMMVVLSINLMGDWLRDRFDPKT